METKTGELLTENIAGVNRILPHKHKFAWDLFLKSCANNWMPTEISMQSDIKQWKNASLLLDTPAKNEWNKFSLTDILWIGIIIELKNFGFTNDKIIKIKEELFKPNKNLQNHSQNVSNINAAIIEVITYSHPIFLVLDVEGNMEIADGFRTIEKLKDGEITDHLILSVNEFFKKNIEKETKKLNYFYLSIYFAIS